MTRPRTRRLLWTAAAALALGTAIGGAWLARREGAVRARALAGEELAAFERCLVGDPLGPNETLAGRLRGIELAIAMQKDASEAPRRPADAGAYDPALELMAKPPSRDDDDTSGGLDGGAAAPAPDAWPSRCAGYAEILAKRLEAPALAADPSLDLLREALPTRSRLEMRVSILPEEAADLAAAIAKAGLPKPADAPSGERPPSPLSAPLPGRGLTSLGKGTIEIRAAPQSSRDRGTDPLATTAIRLLLRGTPPRMCALDGGDAKTAFAVARCGDLPALGGAPLEAPRLAGVEDGAPIALFASKRTDRGTARGVLVLDPTGNKTIPMTAEVSGASAFLTKEGAYMLTSPSYTAFVRTGTVAALKTRDLSDTALDSSSVRAMDSTTDGAVAAYGYVFWVDRPSVYSSNDTSRKLWARRVLPSLDAAPTPLGDAPATSSFLLDGCRANGRTALLFGDDAGYRQKPRTRLVIAEGEGPWRGIDVEIGRSNPHVLCGREAVFVTSVDVSGGPNSAVVVQSRCSANGCETKRSDPIETPFGIEHDAATLDAGVIVLHRLRAERVTSRARGMVLYRFAPLDALAGSAPRPLFENRAHGGFDVDHVRLVPRPGAALVTVETGGKAPSVYAARIDASGVATAVRVEETTW